MKDSLNSKEVNVPTLRYPDWTRVYECKPGISEAQGKKYGKPSGPSFHFILNDVITKDNRIPPRGYRKSAFEEHLAAPVGAATRKTNGGPPLADLEEGVIGAEYADGQYWDELKFALPTGTTHVEVRLMYQSVSWEYLKFLVEENHTDDWGKKLYDAWEATGQCPPEEIAFVTKRVKP